MGAKKLTNVHEALEYLENLDESSEDVLSYDGDFICSGRLVILPPNDEGEMRHRWRFTRWKWASSK